MAFIYYVTQVQFEFGAVRLLKQECDRVGITRPLIVSDPGVKAAGVLQKALDALAGLPVAIFDQTPSNPTEAAVRAAVAVYHANQCDGLIAVGGGSAIDCAKGVAIAATHEGPLTHYATIEGGSPRITDRVAPLIAVPTTSGTGSEVARGAIVIVDDHRKLGFHSWHIVPKTAICDPELTLGLPPTLTAATGMDAIAHCMETFMFRRASRSLPFWVARAMLAQPRSSPSRAMPSAGGLKAGAMKVSIQWAMASMPVVAVSAGGKPRVSSGSQMAVLGTMCQL